MKKNNITSIESLKNLTALSDLDLSLIRFFRLRAWHYVLIEDEEKYVKLKMCKQGTNIDVTDFGKIINRDASRS